MLVQLLVRSLALDTFYARCTLLLVLITTAAVVKVANVLAVKQRLMNPFVNDVVSKA
jgi:hypothetical protein